MKAGRPSATARLVAAATVLASCDGVEPVPSAWSVEFSREALGASVGGRLMRGCIESRIGRASLRGIERTLVPGFVAHIARRKEWVRRSCLDAYVEGFHRLLILGPGMDGLGPGIVGSCPDVEVVEFEHPAMIAARRSWIGRSQRDRLRAVAVDLASPDATVFEQLQEWVLGQRVLVIAEGLLMYLPMQSVRRTLGRLGELPAAATRFAFTFMDQDHSGRIGFRGQSRLADAWLRWHGEPFEWGASRAQAAAMLAEFGFKVIQMADGRELARRWPGPLLEGEEFVLAGRDGRGCEAEEGTKA